MEKIIPREFWQSDHDVIDLGDHSVGYNRTRLDVVSEWTVTVTNDKGEMAEKKFAQPHEQNERLLFYEAYIELCSRLNVFPCYVEE